MQIPKTARIDSPVEFLKHVAIVFRVARPSITRKGLKQTRNLSSSRIPTTEGRLHVPVRVLDGDRYKNAF
jgi:hypothetical protein